MDRIGKSITYLDVIKFTNSLHTKNIKVSSFGTESLWFTVGGVFNMPSGCWPRNSIFFIEVASISTSIGFFPLIRDNNLNGNVNGMDVLVDANNRSILMEALRGVITVL